MSRVVRIGYISGVFGVVGEVRLFLHNPDYDWLTRPRKVTLVGPDGSRRETTLQARPGAGRRILGCIDGVETPEEARDLMGWEIEVPQGMLPKPKAGEWYLSDILGRRVRTDNGRDLGEVVDVHQSGDVDVWEISGPAGTTYLPFLEGRVLEVDDAGILVAEDSVVEDEV